MTLWISSSRFGFLFLLFRSELYASGSPKGVFPHLNPLTYVDVCWRMLFVQTRDTRRPRAWHIMQWQRLRNTLLKKFRFATFHLIRNVSSKNCLVLSIKVLKQSNVTESLFLTLLNSELLNSEIDYVFGVTRWNARGSCLQLKSKMVDSLAGFGSVQITDWFLWSVRQRGCIQMFETAKLRQEEFLVS